MSETSTPVKHLWEVDHPYYCSTMSGKKEHHESWQGFIEDWNGTDPDYNLIIRWDWTPLAQRLEDAIGEDYQPTTDLFEVFYALQRKGWINGDSVDVTAADEPLVIEFLEGKLAYLLHVWEPVRADVTGAGSAKRGRCARTKTGETR